MYNNIGSILQQISKMSNFDVLTEHLYLYSQFITHFNFQCDCHLLKHLSMKVLIKTR